MTKSFSKGLLVGFTAALAINSACAQPFSIKDPFARLTQAELGLGAFRSATGKPSASYWQQRVDYDIDVVLHPAAAQLEASAVVHYHNQSPDALDTLFFNLDHDALANQSAAGYRLLTGDETAQHVAMARSRSDTGFTMESVQRADGKALAWQVKNTLLQVKLPRPLESGEKIALSMQWRLPLTEKQDTVARSGYETLTDGKRIFVAAQWFPRAVAYTDYAGWQLKPFLQQGEFSPEFGRYRVRISAPENFVVAASGELQNPAEVLERQQLRQWKSDDPEPRWIVSAADADENRSHSSERRKQWFFTGEQLRDFAFAASSGFQWQIKRDSRGRRLQLFFPAEAAPLWSAFGLAAMEHTLQVFDQATFPLPLESVSVVNAAGIGMEYPGLATIATRPERSGDSPEAGSADQPPWDALTKYDFIGSIIHEVGHNYLPMTVNTDEREWAWLDEGLVSFIEYRGEHSWEANFDVIYGEPRSVAGYLASDTHQPIMTSADSLGQKIANAYNKTASVLNMLRHLVLEPQEFDRALQQFATAWQGKRPIPGDFFRAMETAAGQDLSWFWRSWFFDAASVDFSVTGILQNDMALPLRSIEQPEPAAVAYTAGGIQQFVVDRQPQLADTYTRPLPARTDERRMSLPPPLPEPTRESRWYHLTIENAGSALLPVPLQVSTENGGSYHLKIPAQTWMRASDGKLALQLPLPVGEVLKGICIDPLWLTPDTDRTNNCIEIDPS